MFLNLVLSLIIAAFVSQPPQSLLLNNNLAVAAKQKVNQPAKKINSSIGVETTAKSVLIIDAETNKILFSKNANEILPIASITKLASALVFLDHNPGWDKEVNIEQGDNPGLGRIYLGKGEKIKINDLFYSALVGSANQSILALARLTGLSKEQFVSEMNNKAKQFGMLNTSFVEPTGLDAANKSTTYDLIKLISQALENKEIKKALTTKGYTFKTLNHYTQTIDIFNTDRLLDSYLNDSKSGYEIIGAKTGSLNEAGYCFVVKIKKDNHPIIIASLDSATSFDRFQEIKGLVNWVYDNYNWPDDV